MRKLRTFALIVALGVIPVATVYADGNCEPIPGQTNTPPCSNGTTRLG